VLFIHQEGGFGGETMDFGAVYPLKGLISWRKKRLPVVPAMTRRIKPAMTEGDDEHKKSSRDFSLLL